MPDSIPPSQARVRVWDVPVRLVHWLIVLSVAGAWWTSETGRMDLHQYCGYALLGLVLFRIYWGFLGSSTARFSQFVRGPATMVGYLKGKGANAIGHNPLGALSVVVLLALLLAQVVLGLFAVDVDGIESGPLSTFVSFDAGRTAAWWHEKIFDGLMWFVGLHIAAVLHYVLIKKQNLITAMLNGHRTGLNVDAAPVKGAGVVRFLLGAILAAALTWWVARAFHF